MFDLVITVVADLPMTADFLHGASIETMRTFGLDRAVLRGDSLLAALS